MNKQNENIIKFVDFHTHLHQYSNTEKLIEEINTEQIVSIGASVDIQSYILTKKLQNKSDFIIPTFGIHPMFSNFEYNFKEIDGYLENSLLIGEIGLDLMWFKNISIEDQKKIFNYILNHCNETKKYCVIHTTGAEKEVLEILDRYKNCKPIIHWYDGPIDIYKKMLDRGYLFTFSCDVKYSDHIKNLLRITPLNRVLSETDNPESEIWLGGNSNSPSLIKRVVSDIALVKNIEPNEMKSIIYNNSLKVLNESGIKI